MAVSGAPDTKALIAAAEQLDRTWDAWVSAEDDDRPFAAVEEAVGSLRRVLQGTRRMKLSKDSYDYWRSRCSCGWPGSPWSGGSVRVSGALYLRPISGRQQAVNEFAEHVCYQED